MSARPIKLLLLGLGLLMLTTSPGCDKPKEAAATSSDGMTHLTLTLDWKPEPEFGGFYAAQLDSDFIKNGLAAAIQPAGEGAATWQLVGAGKTDFATTSADQVLIARQAGADITAIFTVYQTFPQGVMVHQARGFKTMKDVFTHPGTLQAEDNAWLHFLEKHYGTPVVKIIPYTGGISQFLAQKDCSQQCFVTSEPILAKKAGSDPQTFLISDEGYNPYTTVVICQSALLKSNPAEVKAMVTACRAGWQAYLADPSKANAAMHAANSDMDADTFAAGAAAQKPFIQPAGMTSDQLGTMTADRWNTLSNELIELGVLDNAASTPDCFVNP